MTRVLDAIYTTESSYAGEDYVGGTVSVTVLGLRLSFFLGRRWGMTRAEHLQWAKIRALAYLPEEPFQAMASFVSDLGKHKQLAGHAAIELFGMAAAAGMLDDREARDLIEGSA